MPVFQQATKFARIGSRVNLTRTAPNTLNRIQSRNSAQHWDLQSFARQWPRFPALRRDFVPDDDVILSFILFWFFIKSRMKDDSEPPSKRWQEAVVVERSGH
mmetsp:Transcript_27409/g.45085  ORF Transcript_27409/g.45085 Transcript_27409/m.45085 type:complete len:102 (-) Transcript_27409:242-547(-)